MSLSASDCIESLTALGFSSRDATRAVTHVGCDVDSAVSWILLHEENAEILEPGSTGPLPPLHENNKEDGVFDHVIEEIVAMGFELESAKKAVELFGNNSSDAVNWILQGMPMITQGTNVKNKETGRSKKTSKFIPSSSIAASMSNKSEKVASKPATESSNTGELEDMTLVSQAVWFQDIETLSQCVHAFNKLDLRGNTALSLAVQLGYNDVVNFLLSHGADPRICNSMGWNVLQEACILKLDTMIMDLYLNKVILDCKDWETKLPILQAHILKMPDFYMEIKWEVKSWVPFIGSLAPNDTFKIWKQGAALRFDSFKSMGTGKDQHVSFLFSSWNDSTSVFLIDRTNELYEDALLQFRNPPYEMIKREVQYLIKSETVSSDFSTSQAVYQNRNTMFGVPVKEVITEWESSVIDISGLKYQMKKANAAPVKPDFEEYFSNKTRENTSESFIVDKEVTAAVWLSQSFPLSRKDINTVLEIVAPASPDLGKIKNIFGLNLPVGFPVKLEIPVLPAVIACVTFSKFEVLKDPLDQDFFAVPDNFGQRM